jgi:hypothetical protein
MIAILRLPVKTHWESHTGNRGNRGSACRNCLWEAGGHLGSTSVQFEGSLHRAFPRKRHQQRHLVSLHRLVQAIC